MDLKSIQERFEEVTEKEHWEKLKTLLFSEDKENVVMGMNLLKTLEQEVYYDGVCTFLEDDGKGNWLLNSELECSNDVALMAEILLLAEETVEHEIHTALQDARFEDMFLRFCGETEFGELPQNQKERLLYRMSEMIKIERDKGDYLIMKYPVTQAIWENATGKNPSRYRGASRPVDCANWFECVAFANLLSEREGLEKVYEISGKDVQMKKEANGYRLPTKVEWRYAAKGGEYYTFAGSDDPDEVCWYWGNCGKGSKSVGRKKANGYGLYDMSGNVWEWCWDRIEEESRVYRVYMGGSWSGTYGNCELSYSGQCTPVANNTYIGVRFVRSISKER